jgi:hypothetical protein
MSSTSLSHVVDKQSLPQGFPTHMHEASFWEHLGRAVGTFGFLEEVLGRAIFALTAAREYPATEVEAAYADWLPQLERALYDTLSGLIDVYANAASKHQSFNTTNVSELIDGLRRAAVWRNVLRHGSWRVPGEDGKSLPLFMNSQKELFDTPVDVAMLKQIQTHVAELACEVMSTITAMGLLFPGSDGPGKPIWTKTSGS